MQTTELCQLIPTMPNCPRCLSKPVKPSRLQATSRFWLGAGGWRLYLVVMLGLGIVMEAGAMAPLTEDRDKVLGLFHNWEEPGLLAALQDRSEKTRLTAMDRLKSRPTQNDVIIKHIVEWLNDRNTRINALDMISHEEYIQLAPRVAAFLEDSDVNVRYWAIHTLGQMGNSANPYVKKIADRLSNSDKTTRLEALYALANMGEAAHPYAEKIANRLSDSDEGIRAAALMVPANINEATHFSKEIADRLSDEDLKVRLRALNVLSSMGNAARAFGKKIA